MSGALRLGASGTACSRAWLELYGKSFGCGGPHAHGSSNCLVSAVVTRRGVVKARDWGQLLTADKARRIATNIASYRSVSGQARIAPKSGWSYAKSARR